MSKHVLWCAYTRATAVPAAVALVALAGCANATDDSQPGDPPGVGQMPVGAGGSGAPPAASGGAGMMVGPGAFGTPSATPPGGSGGGSAAGAAGTAGTGVGPGDGGGAGLDVSQAGSDEATAGSGQSAGSGEPEAGAGGSGAPMEHEDLGQGDGKDVITIGDSWMNLILAGIEQSLEKVSGRDYRNYSVPGTLVLNEQIPGQYESAKMEDPDIKTVVMTGGGNDILTSSCADEACNPIVDDVSDRLFMLMSEMGADGVEDVVLIGYTYPSDTSKHASLDHSREISATQCTEDTTPRCHYLDSTMLDITLRDGIHPDDAGYDLIGTTVWQLMQAKGMRR